jgi:hypothetical protein
MAQPAHFLFEKASSIFVFHVKKTRLNMLMKLITSGCIGSDCSLQLLFSEKSQNNSATTEARENITTDLESLENI